MLASPALPTTAPPSSRIGPRVAALHRPFFLAAIAIVLTVGAAWGVLLLGKITLAGTFTGISVHEANAHGHAQIMGWVGLFVMGFAYQAFPRTWQTDPPSARLAIAVLGAMIVGIVARGTAMMAAANAWATPLHTAGATLETVAVAVFVAQLAAAFRRSGQPISPSIAFIFAGLAFMLIQTVFGSWHVAALIAAPDRERLLEQIATYQAPLRDVQIHGMALFMILGVGLRMFPAIFGLAETPARRGWAAFGLLLAAVVGEVALFLAYRYTGRHALAAALLLPWLTLPIGVGLIVWPWRLWRAPTPTAAGQRSAKFVRAAFAWLFVSFAMLLAMPVYLVAADTAFSHAYHGAVRHAITVGFISMMIVGVASTVVPRLRGVASVNLPALWLPFVLLNVGCMLRVTTQIGTDWHDGFYRVIAASGAMEWTALAVWAAHVVALMAGKATDRGLNRGCA